MIVIKIYIYWNPKGSKGTNLVRKICFGNDGIGNSGLVLRGSDGRTGLIFGSNVYKLLTGKYKQDFCI